jgi:hypothetical protein
VSPSSTLVLLSGGPHEPAHIRQYQAYLFRDRKLSPNTVNQRTGALRFFFITVLRKSWSIADTPYRKRNFRLPKVLSQQQVEKLIDAATTPFYRIILITLYATGLRRAEHNRRTGALNVGWRTATCVEEDLHQELSTRKVNFIGLFYGTLHSKFAVSLVLPAPL